MAVRRVRRVVRKIDPWTVLKFSLIFNAIAGLMFVLGTWVVWSLLLQRGVPDKVVDIFEQLTFSVTIDGPLYFRVVVFLAIVGAVVMTGLMTLGAVLYNLISDLVGGIEITVLEETYNVQPQPQTVVQSRVRPAVHRSGNGQGGRQQPVVTTGQASVPPQSTRASQPASTERAATQPARTSKPS